MTPTRFFKPLSLRLRGAIIIFFTFSTVSLSIAQGTDSPVAVRIVSDESDAVLAILAKKRSNQTVTDQDWRQLFSCEGYVRLKKREASLHRDFTDEEFKSFVLSDTVVARLQTLKATLDKWKTVDVATAARRALAYLPEGAKIKTTIYPVIKPNTNSFVFETTSNPAIFLYINPEVSADELENTLAHELHHIGYANSCAALSTHISEDSALSKNIRLVLAWVGAFGEGYAMLAAAGGPDIHPHAVSKPEEKARWDNDMRNVNADLKTVELFFLDVLDNKLSSEEIQRTAASFFGIQGPWYTVGWNMAVAIENTYGRAKLIECICDPRLLLPTYNQAALEHNRVRRDSLAVWSPLLVERILK